MNQIERHSRASTDFTIEKILAKDCRKKETKLKINTKNFGESFGESFGKSFGESFGEKFGKNSGESFGENFGENSGENFGENSGESFGKNFGEKFEKNSGENFEKNSGENFGKNSGESFGKNSGKNFGENSSRDNFDNFYKIKNEKIFGAKSAASSTNFSDKNIKIDNFDTIKNETIFGANLQSSTKFCDKNIKIDNKIELSWLQCTRYRPPKVLRKNVGNGKSCKRRPGSHPRIPFTSSQLQVLEDKYRGNAYLSRRDVLHLSTILRLPQSRVKIWFQNRRARDRRESGISSSNITILSSEAPSAYKAPEISFDNPTSSNPV